MGYTPKLFIGIGATNAFYTLRETYLYERVVGQRIEREIRSFHHFNLSQDVDEAIEKAAEASLRMGVEFNQTRDSLVSEMREIKRATADQLAAREAAYKEQTEFYEALRAQHKAEQEQGLRAGEITFGRFNRYKVADLPRDYITWVVKKLAEFEEGSLMRLLAEILRDNHADKMLPEPDADKVVGEPGQRVELDVEVLRIYPCQSDFGTLYIITMVTAERACVVSKSTSFHTEVGKRLKIKATVKKHDNYKGQAQTQVQRIKVLTEAA